LNALKNYASIDDSEGKLRARDLLGLAVMENGELDVARSQFEETLSEARAANDPRAISASLNNLGRLVGEYEGRFDLAMPMFAESLSTARTNGLASQAVSALTNLSQCTLALGQYTAGLTYARLGIVEAAKLGNREAAADLALQAVAHGLYGHPFIAVRDDAFYACEAVVDLPYRPPIAARLDDVAFALHAAGQLRRAAKLLGASYTFRPARRGRRERPLGGTPANCASRIGEMLSPGEPKRFIRVERRFYCKTHFVRPC